MKDIVYCKTPAEWLRVSENLEDPVHIPLNRIIINYEGSDGKGSIYQDLDQLPIVARLNDISQLGLADRCTKSIQACGTRYGHSIICASKIDRLAQIHDLDRELGVCAGMTHDVATPPRSDSSAVGLSLSDEGWFGYVIDQCPELDALLDKYSVSRGELVDAVRGRGKNPITQLINRPGSLDVDRCSYTAYDSQNLGMVPWGCIEAQPDPFSSIDLYNGEIVFLDPDSVAKCLDSRVNLFERFYKNPCLRAKEAFAGEVARELMDKGIIDHKSIFRMVDVEYDKLVLKHGGILGERLYRLDGFDSYGSVQAGEAELKGHLQQITDRPFVIKRHKVFDPGVETPVVVDGTVMPYREWNPVHAGQLKRRMGKWDRTFVYGYENDKVLERAVDGARREFGFDAATRMEEMMECFDS
ncbi:MAG: hypothetical protein JW727_00595 [Candidatus Aenigmarchaeota archaeon]|nr:hypothetical protein [Candidatus Aenigmarchaeota archaeon]